MAGEQNYTSHLYTYGDAIRRLEGFEKNVLQYAWDVYHHTLTIEECREREKQGSRLRSAHASLTFSCPSGDKLDDPVDAEIVDVDGQPPKKRERGPKKGASPSARPRTRKSGR